MTEITHIMEDRMKKFLKSILVLTVALAMLLSLAACGDGTDDKENGSDLSTEEEQPRYGYVSKFTELDEKEFGNINILNMDENGLLYTQLVKVGEDIPEGVTPSFEGEYDIYETKLGVMD